ncbi:MAG: hypothetical protein IKT67_04900 [Lachnospiraceae bacterium]|nr:hypothetical protein [Lachnospiraceae bacterium]
MWIFSIVANVIGWAIFTFSDFLEETGNESSFMGFVFWGVPAAVGLAYIIRNLMVRKEGPDSVKECLKNAGKWLLVSGVIGVGINVAVIFDRWFVKQATGGWENFLNGIEYALFALFLTGGVLVVIILWNILRWLYGFIRKCFV